MGKEGGAWEILLHLTGPNMSQPQPGAERKAGKSIILNDCAGPRAETEETEGEVVFPSYASQGCAGKRGITE